MTARACRESPGGSSPNSARVSRGGDNPCARHLAPAEPTASAGVLSRATLSYLTLLYAPDKGKLIGDRGVARVLGTRACAVMRLLMEGGDAGVSRAAIVQTFWPAGAAHWTDKEVSDAVGDVRARLVDVSGRVRLQTVYRQGYRLFVWGMQ